MKLNIQITGVTNLDELETIIKKIAKFQKDETLDIVLSVR